MVRSFFFLLFQLTGMVGIHAQGYFDCYDVWKGPNLPNTSCVTAAGDAGTWSVNCACIPNAEAFDCNGTLNGGAFPGGICQWTNDSVTFRMGIWSTNCTCDLDSTYMAKDCQEVTGGHAWPGTPCVMPGSKDPGVWSARCRCEVGSPVPCIADFWTVQAHRADSLPAPYVLWLWDVSHHGTDAHTYQWDFGDGSFSQERYPRHTYTTSGPYELCLTIDNGRGCTSKKCRTVAVDNDGAFNGLVALTDNSIGFMVFAPCLKGIELAEQRAFNGIAIRPLLASDQLEVEFMSKAERTVTLSLAGADGQPRISERRRAVVGKNVWSIPKASLPPDTYLVKITDDPKTIAQRLITSR